MNKKQQVIQLHLQDVSQRQISTEVKVFRNTVSKYIEAFEKNKATDVRNLPVTEDILSPPSYRKRAGVKRKMTEEIVERIQEFEKTRPCPKDNSTYSQQLHAEKAEPRNHKGFGLWQQYYYRNIQLFIITPFTGNIWETAGN